MRKKDTFDKEYLPSVFICLSSNRYSESKVNFKKTLTKIIVSAGTSNTTSAPETVEKEPVEPETILSPIKGVTVPLSDVKDEVFASESLGKGVAILPDEGKVYSPVDGKVTVVFPTKHAIGINSDNGAELLIHIGMDTVQLEGKGFTSHVEQNQMVHKGDLLMEFDVDGITSQGYDVTTPIIITNTKNYNKVDIVASGQVNHGDEVIKLS